MGLKYHLKFEVCSILLIYNGEILKISVGCWKKVFGQHLDQSVYYLYRVEEFVIGGSKIIVINKYFCVDYLIFL